MMDPLIFAGLSSVDQKIIEYTMEYLNVKDLTRATNEVSACKRNIIVLAQKIIPRLTDDKAAKLLRFGTSLIHYTNKSYRAAYLGDSKIYHFIYLNLKRKVEGESYYELKDFYKRAIERFPETESMNFFPAKAFSIYFLREGMSTAEIATLLDIKVKREIRVMELEKKDLYLSAIDSTLEDMIKEKQQTK